MAENEERQNQSDDIDIVVGSDDDGVIDQIDDHTDDPDVLDDFADRQRLHSGSDKLLESLREHNSQSPRVSGGDIDAAWDSSVVSGEESVGGTVPTPDQDVVDEIGDALGIVYADDEPLATADKLQARDDNRWELNPASAMSLDQLDEEEDDSFEEDDDLDDLDEDLLDVLDEDGDLEEDEEIEAELDADVTQEERVEYGGYDEDELEEELDELDELDVLDDEDLYDDLDDDMELDLGDDDR